MWFIGLIVGAIIGAIGGGAAMSGNTLGKLFCVTSFGESHGPARALLKIVASNSKAIEALHG